MKPKLASYMQCTGCLACVDACSNNAIIKYIHKDGHYYTKVDSFKCVECGLCSKKCPVVSKFIYKKTDNHSKPFAAWNTNVEQRLTSTSGGIFSALATSVLNRGGKVVGVAMERSYAKHIMISSLDELPLLQGSKYQQSDTENIYKTTLNELKKGIIVLFQGTACQVAGLLSFLGNRHFENLITVDIICGGVPSRLPIDYFLRESKSKEILGYRDKKNGWEPRCHLLTKSQFGEIERDTYLSEIVLNSFLAAKVDRYSCDDCRFNGISRKADITIADFWGDDENTNQHKAGISFVTVHSENGQKLLNESTIETKKTTFHKALRKNPRMIYGKRPFSKFSLTRRLASYNFKHLSRKNILALYCSIYPSALWYPVKAFRYFRWKISQMIKNHYVKNELKEIL